jgi:hypothetical protein
LSYGRAKEQLAEDFTNSYNAAWSGYNGYDSFYVGPSTRSRLGLSAPIESFAEAREVVFKAVTYRGRYRVRIVTPLSLHPLSTKKKKNALPDSFPYVLEERVDAKLKPTLCVHVRFFTLRTFATFVSVCPQTEATVQSTTGARHRFCAGLGCSEAPIRGARRPWRAG